MFSHAISTFKPSVTNFVIIETATQVVELGQTRNFGAIAISKSQNDVKTE